MGERIYDTLTHLLSERFQTTVKVLARRPVSGGCIHNAEYVKTNVGEFFFKHNARSHYENFQAEADGLRQLQSTNTLAVPTVHLVAATEHDALLVLEYIVQGVPSAKFWETFGEQLAALHRHTQMTFGYVRDNFIGALPQRNRPHSSWVEFFICERLQPMVERAVAAGQMTTNAVQRFESLYPKLPSIFPSEPPALLHGDLWSGNFLCNAQGNPVVFDPAVYFGHREAELAFMHLFGGFDQRLFDAYHCTFPLAPNWRARIDLYNLYPLLVHLNLFGRSYWSAIDTTLRRYGA
ncbi:MAG: fructosamine kinase family protein [Chloroherpetonaceae bacterium]|nr:fructosamine kinase family protein [Chloroherpetonaceae bacterium]